MLCDTFIITVISYSTGITIKTSIFSWNIKVHVQTHCPRINKIIHFLPGKMIDVKLVYEKLEVGDLYRRAVSHDCGAVSLFVGTTRDNFNDCKVKRLVYESYDQMAIPLIDNICKDIKTRWQSVRNVIIHHRLGEVPVGEASIVIAISSPHRQDSLEAVQFAINEIKSTIPIFKKEEYENGDSAWKENKECKWSSTS